jgi:hypothetical protein
VFQCSSFRKVVRTFTLKKTPNIFVFLVFNKLVNNYLMLPFFSLTGTFNAIHPRLLLTDFDEGEHVDAGLEGDVEYMTWTPEEGYDNQKKEPYPR